jgi:hypothetical protein
VTSAARADGRPNRFAVAAVAFIAGLVYGALATIGHRHELRLGDIVLPWGIVAALTGVAALLIGIRLMIGRLAAGAAAVGVIVIVALLSLPGLGGSVLVPATTIGTIWAVGPALIAVLVVAWPSAALLRGRPGAGRPAVHTADRADSPAA